MVCLGFQGCCPPCIIENRWNEDWWIGEDWIFGHHSATAEPSIVAYSKRNPDTPDQFVDITLPNIDAGTVAAPDVNAWQQVELGYNGTNQITARVERYPYEPFDYQNYRLIVKHDGVTIYQQEDVNIYSANIQIILGYQQGNFVVQYPMWQNGYTSLAKKVFTGYSFNGDGTLAVSSGKTCEFATPNWQYSQGETEKTECPDIDDIPPCICTQCVQNDGFVPSKVRVTLNGITDWFNGPGECCLGLNGDYILECNPYGMEPGPGVLNCWWSLFLDSPISCGVEIVRAHFYLGQNPLDPLLSLWTFALRDQFGGGYIWQEPFSEGQTSVDNCMFTDFVLPTTTLTNELGLCDITASTATVNYIP